MPRIGTQCSRGAAPLHGHQQCTPLSGGCSRTTPWSWPPRCNSCAPARQSLCSCRARAARPPRPRCTGSSAVPRCSGLCKLCCARAHCRRRRRSAAAGLWTRHRCQPPTSSATLLLICRGRLLSTAVSMCMAACLSGTTCRVWRASPKWGRGCACAWPRRAPGKRRGRASSATLSLSMPPRNYSGSLAPKTTGLLPSGLRPLFFCRSSSFSMPPSTSFVRTLSSLPRH